MLIDRRTRLRLRFESYLFVVLLVAAIGLLAWLSNRYAVQADWTAAHRNSLSTASRKVLTRLHGPVHITAFARPDQVLRARIRNLVARYRRAKADIKLEMVNPDTAPQRVRELDVTTDGTLLVAYQGRSEKLTELSEGALTNALLRLARGARRWVVFLSGDGERDPLGRANSDLGQFGHALQRKGITVQTLNLGATPGVPDNTSVLVIAGPRTDLLPGEVRLIRAYVAHGGNLLWLADPAPLHGLQPLAQDLGLKLLPGVIVDATTRLFGINSPDFAIVSRYPDHPITRGFRLLTLFPRAAALVEHTHGNWHATAVLRTAASSWNETGPLQGEIRMDAARGEQAGPLTLGLALSRPRPGSDSTTHGKPAATQRVMVVGDGNFLSNTYLGNGGNLELGLRIIDWLDHDDRFIAIPPKSAPDVRLNLSTTAGIALGAGFLLVLPLMLLGTGVAMWLRRRRR